MASTGGTSTLRAHAPSPTSSASSQNTTPTSPHFITHSTHVQAHSQPSSRFGSTHPYASGSSGYPHDARSASSLSISHPRPTTPPLLQPPPDQSFTAYLRSWGDAEIASFLSMHRCGQYASAFKQNDITGSVLLDLDINALKEIGVAKVGERVKLHGGIKDLRRRAHARQPPSLHNSTSSIDIRINGSSAGASLADSSANGGAEDGTQRTRRIQTRPPPLDILPHVGGRPLPQAYQNPVPSAGSPSLTPRPRPVHSSSSSTTIAPATPASTPSTTGPPRSTSFNANLRAPPPRDGLRRSPSPGTSGSTSDALNFLERPLPPAPDRPIGQSSAAEYASAITQQRNAHSTSDSIHGLSKDPTPAKSTAHLQAVRADHRKYPSLGTPTKTSPIRSTFQNIKAGTSSGATHPFAASQDKNNLGYRNPQTGGVLSRSASSDMRQPTNQLPLEDIRRQFVRFVNSEDGTSRTVGVADCTSGVEVLERVLKKFGMWNTGASVHVEGDSDSDGDRLEVDGWGVYAESEPDDDAKPLSEASLLAVCLANRDGIAVREKGLVIRQKNKQHQRRKNMEEFLGDAPPPPMSPTSPKYVTGPRFGIQEDAMVLTPSRLPQSNKKKMNRASTVSVMSGLGVPLPDGSYPPSPSAARTPTGGSFLGIRRKPLYNFFGHRPPSELIANHLGEYFPSAKRKELEKSRNSMLRLSTGPRRLSSAPSEKRGSSETDRRSIATTPKRKSHRPSSRATMTSPPSAPIPEEGETTEVEGVPRVSVSNDSGRVSRPKIDGESDSGASVESQPPLLPPFEPSKESLADSLKAFSPLPKPQNRPLSLVQGRRGSGSSAKSRISMMSQLRKNRDRSDTASLLTVDEITAEVEQRRASTITFDESSGDEAMDVPPSVDHGNFPQSEIDEGIDADDEEYESSEEEESDDDDEEEEEEEEEEELEDEHGKAFTSTGSRIFKWIKGALIGAGSFGSVYLGMDAQSGLLMAVKQVELPTGSEKNEERKRNMVGALEREIELLKELQHENIVQYLDSSADGAYLNIFLEYVPGGSVAALLNNYGAFEEALVRNFCRQILTGLNYLHERDIIHRDIKGANILVDNKGGIKISDFGISKKVESSELLAGGSRAAHRPSLQGSVFWMAPEVVKQTSYTKAADIWSVGCLVVEMLTGTRPWADLSQMQAMYRIGQVARPATPADISPEAADFLARTFEFDHSKRPTAAELLEHPFIAPKPGSSAMLISAAQARQAMAQANKSRENMMGGMQSLSAFG